MSSDISRMLLSGESGATFIRLGESDSWGCLGLYGFIAYRGSWRCNLYCGSLCGLSLCLLTDEYFRHDLVGGHPGFSKHRLHVGHEDIRSANMDMPRSDGGNDFLQQLLRNVPGLALPRRAAWITHYECDMHVRKSALYVFEVLAKDNVRGSMALINEVDITGPAAIREVSNRCHEWRDAHSSCNEDHTSGFFSCKCELARGSRYLQQIAFVNLIIEKPGDNAKFLMLYGRFTIFKLRWRGGNGVGTLGPVPFGRDCHRQELTGKIDEWERVTRWVSEPECLDVRRLLKNTHYA